MKYNMSEFILDGQGISAGNITVRMAQNNHEVICAKKIRYHIFYEEFDAKPLGDIATQKRDFDKFDDYADHLIVIDNTIDDVDSAIVGTYRLMGEEGAQKAGGFYTSDEFDISKLLENQTGLLEMGRSCVLPDYRTKAVLQLLWQGIAEYVTYHKIRYLFGCASFHGTDPKDHAESISYLYHNHLAPSEFRPVGLKNPEVKMNTVANDDIDIKKVIRGLPPLIKGYIRIGGVIGDGVYIDREFDTVDVCVVLSTNLISDGYLKHYERKTGAEITRD
jgi:putative hemolysin